MVRKLRTPEAVDSLGDAFSDEEDFNESLKQYPDPLEDVLDVRIYKKERERVVDFGQIDLYAHILASDDDTLIVESQIGELDNDHIARGYKYAIDQNSDVLVYIADKFSPATLQLLKRINENDDSLSVFALNPAIHQSPSGEVTIFFQQKVAPDNWETYLESYPAGIHKHRAFVFDFLQDKLANCGLPSIRRNRIVPNHSGFQERQTSFSGRFRVFYSVKKRVSTASITGSDIDNINLRIEKKQDKAVGPPEQELQDLLDLNEEELDNNFDSYHGFCGWGNRMGITIDTDTPVDEHKKIAEWFAQQRQTLSDIENNLELDVF